MEEIESYISCKIEYDKLLIDSSAQVSPKISMSKNMNIGDKFKHKYNKAISCEIVSFTARGVKVKQTQGRKGKQAFYDLQDFENSERGLWLK